MKKSSRAAGRALSLLMVFAVSAGLLSGCGNKNAEGAGLSEYVYVPHYTKLPEEITDISSPCMAGDTIYFSASLPVHADGTPATQEEVDAMNGYETYTKIASSGAYGTATVAEAGTAPGAELDTSDITYKNFLYSIKADGTDYKKLPDYVPLDAGDDPYSYAGLDRLVADAKGDIWVAESVSKTIFDLPEGFDADTQDPWEYYVNDERSSYIRKLSGTGAELASVDLGQYIARSQEEEARYGGYFYINAMLTDSAGNLYISADEGAVYVFGPDAEFLFKLKTDGWISGLVRVKDGSIGAPTNVQSADGESYSMVIKTIDPAAKDWGEEYPAPSDVWQTSDGGDTYDFCYTDSSSLFGYSTETEASEKILTWLNCDVDGDSVRFSTVRDNGDVFAISQDYSGDGDASLEIVTLAKTLRSAVKQKTVLTLATLYLDYNLRRQLLKFNKTSEDYRIEIQDYSEFNTGEDYNAGATKLSTEIISGKIPDLIDVSNLPFKQYAAKGLLEDLYAYIDADAGLSREDLIPAILGVLETDGKLYQLATSFSVSSIVASPGVAGPEPGWTMDELQQILNDNPQADYPFGMDMTKEGIFQYIAMLNIDRYLNWQTGECRFNSDDFKKLLAFANTFPEREENQAGYGKEIEWIDSSVLIRDGRQLFTIFGAGDFDSFQYYKASHGGQIVFKGFPSESGDGGGVAQMSGGIAMTSACRDKDGAWQFVRALISEDYQESLNWNFPVNRKAFDKKLAEAMKQEYTTDENGERVPVSRGGMSIDDGAMVEFYAITQEEADQIRALIDSVTGTFNYDQSMMELINEEAAYYFAGEKTVDETADIIQSRMTLYINEQR
ncbi:MAG: extracellular solute-binding protein [Oscillospiraceae bacterium]|jgi:ABC-type glycerol-3-phosphate transport system substrate-binding protein|nr:extracellular solute-binding protein [Oscillospiraceae bacterium]